MEEDKKAFHRRQFLNDEEGMAAYEATVYNRSWDDERKDKPARRRISIDGSFSVTDCHRSISLDVDISDEESLGRTVRKLNRLARAVEDLRDALVKTARREGIKSK